MPIDFTRTSVKGVVNFSTFGCNVYKGSYPTPDRVKPDIYFEREFYGNGKLRFQDGFEAEIWGFNDPLNPDPVMRDRPFPSPLIRVREGQVVHVKLKSHKNTHTIHHHGIEPTTFNDGVGHMSFEVNGEYVYQWTPSEPGTYFYHCHKNTVLHFEKGMYGPLIVDPPSGPGTMWTGGPAYDVETSWFFDDMDPRWHSDNNILEEHDAGLCGDDVGLNRFEPAYFLISGVPSHLTETDARVAVVASPGQRILMRLCNSSYSIIRYRIGLATTLYSVDGHGLGRPGSPWSKPVARAANTWHEITTAQRHDVIAVPTQRGVYQLEAQFLNWANRDIQAGGKGVIRTRIIVI